MRLAVAGGVSFVLTLLAMPAGAQENAPTSGQDPVLAGLYSDQWHSATDLEGLGVAAGKRVSLMGTFHHLWESENGSEANTDWLLEQAWSAQATPLANVEVMVAAAEIASGVHDQAIARWAERVKGWLDRGEGRSLLIAPLQEMNGDWVPYGMDPEGFQAAFRRFVEVFRMGGLDETLVRWVFAPNAWSVWPYRIEDYYPGDDVVDFVGISVYNFGNIAGRWTGVLDSGMGALDELRTFAPEKPFLIAQVGSSTAGGDRDTWLRELFQAAAEDPNVVGLVYFNFDKETDWKVWDGQTLATGWRDGMQMATTVHRWPLTSWFQPGPIPFSPFAGRFADDDMLGLQTDIEWLAERGITRGCASDRYCPGIMVTREQLATFLARALDLPPSPLDYFGDDNGSPHEPDINALAAAGITSGCGPGQFCPSQLLSRQQLASMLVEALDLPSSSASSFRDLSGVPDAADVNALRAAGITSGCAPDQFCPWDGISREQMAAFLRRSLERAASEDRTTLRPWWRGIGPV
jgi:hypothetical protein